MEKVLDWRERERDGKGKRERKGERATKREKENGRKGNSKSFFSPK